MEKILFLCLLLSTEIIAQLEVNDPCGPKNEGKCVLVDACPTAVKELKATRKNHSLERCGFVKLTEVVCCMDELVETRNPGKTSRKSVEACRKYAQDVEPIPFIINGVNASLKEFPHMAALGYNTTNSDQIAWGRCGGTLISENYVLTAGHCVFTVTQEVPVMVRLGKIDLLGNADDVEPQDIPVARNILNPDYQHLKKTNDIALIRLARSAVFNDYVHPICLYTDEVSPKTFLTITGWGVTNRTDETSTSRFLLKASVSAVDLDSCNATYQRSGFQRTIISSQFCAISKDELPSDTCQGDSGGPLHVNNLKNDASTPLRLVGVTSFGRGCGNPVPSIYTRVYSYLKWIEDEVWPGDN